MFHINVSLMSKTKALEATIDQFHDKLIDVSLSFNKAIKTYLKEGRSSDFEKYSKQEKKIEHDADALRRDIEKRLYSYNLLPDLRADVLKLVENLDKVINKFEEVNTTSEIANKYAIEEDKFEGKFGETYVLPTYGQEKHRKVIVIGFGKKEEFNPNKLREAIAKAVKKAMSIEAKTVAFKLDGVEFDYSEQFTMGAKIADYKFDKYKSEKKDKGIKEVFVEANETTVRKAEKVADAMMAQGIC